MHFGRKSRSSRGWDHSYEIGGITCEVEGSDDVRCSGARSMMCCILEQQQKKKKKNKLRRTKTRTGLIDVPTIPLWVLEVGPTVHVVASI